MEWAKKLAQSLVCDKTPYKGCGTCGACERVEQKQSENVLFIEASTLEIKMKDVRSITSFLSLQSGSVARVIIIDQAHSLNLQACNFLLKIVEEPPPSSYFLFLTSQEKALPSTLLSRLQKFYFPSLSPFDEGYEWAEEELSLNKISLDLIKQILETKSLPFAITMPVEFKNRKQARFLCKSLKWLFRDARFFKLGERACLINKKEHELLKSLSRFSSENLDSLLVKTLDLEKNLQAYGDSVLCFENFMVAIFKLLKGN